jgi:hypothetical protein
MFDKKGREISHEKAVETPSEAYHPKGYDSTTGLVD